MNYLLLYSVGRYCNYKYKLWRISLGAAFGALYVCAIFFPNFNMLFSSITKVIISIIMINIAFNVKTIRSFLKTFILFYAAAFILSGCILGIFYFFKADFETVNGSFIIKDIKPWHLIVGSVLTNILIKIAFDYLDNYHKIQKSKIDLMIVIEGRSASVKALIDTGNSLKEPISNKPVVVVYANAILNILPQDIHNIVMLNQSCNFKLYDKLMESDTKYKVMNIPYNTLGVENGRLIGIYVDSIEVKTKTQKTILNNCIIALYNKPLSILGDYEALAYPEILCGGS